MLDDRRVFPAKLIGTDHRSDLAVLKIDADSLFPAEWGDSEAAEVGSMVWAVGSPYGLEQTVTSGILSAKERLDNSGTSHEFLQTDAAINPGNSGGPLVNARGQVIGINTSIYGETFLGISFAVPSSIARFVFEQIVEQGTVTRGYLGIQPRQVRDLDMKRNGMTDLCGAVIESIPDNGPAWDSDLRPGDVIRRWDGRDIKTYNTIFRYIGMSRPYSVVDVEILREGRPMIVQVKVGELREM
jgi:serine protease Do